MTDKNSEIRSITILNLFLFLFGGIVRELLPPKICLDIFKPTKFF